MALFCYCDDPISVGAIKHRIKEALWLIDHYSWLVDAYMSVIEPIVSILNLLSLTNLGCVPSIYKCKM